MSDVTPAKVQRWLDVATRRPWTYISGKVGTDDGSGRIVDLLGEMDDTMDARLAAAAPDIAAAYLRLAAQVARVEALTGGPLSDGYQPYALAVDGEVILAVGLDDLRVALDPEDKP